MDDSNNQDNKKTNSSPVSLHSLFSISVRNLINARSLRLTVEPRRRGASLRSSEPGPSAEINEEQIVAFKIEVMLHRTLLNENQEHLVFVLCMYINLSLYIHPSDKG